MTKQLVSVPPPPHTLGAVSPPSAIMVYENLVIDILFMFKLEEWFCGGLEGGKIIQGNFSDC